MPFERQPEQNRRLSPTELLQQYIIVSLQQAAQAAPDRLLNTEQVYRIFQRYGLTHGFYTQAIEILTSQGTIKKIEQESRVFYQIAPQQETS